MLTITIVNYIRELYFLEGESYTGLRQVVVGESYDLFVRIVDRVF